MFGLYRFEKMPTLLGNILKILIFRARLALHSDTRFYNLLISDAANLKFHLNFLWFFYDDLCLQDGLIGARRKTRLAKLGSADRKLPFLATQPAYIWSCRVRERASGRLRWNSCSSQAKYCALVKRHSSCWRTWILWCNALSSCFNAPRIWNSDYLEDKADESSFKQRMRGLQN